MNALAVVPLCTKKEKCRHYLNPSPFNTHLESCQNAISRNVKINLLVTSHNKVSNQMPHREPRPLLVTNQSPMVKLW